MNSCFLRAMLVATLGVVHVFGGMTSGSAGVQQVQAPACGMACCVKNVCECQPELTDTPAQPVPAAPGAPRLETKFVPILLVILHAPVARSMAPAVHSATADGTHLGRGRETPMFRLHCALLM